jgi:hypothetical protein
MSTEENLDTAIELLEAQMEKPEVREWLTIRREAGLKLDPKTAEVTWWHAQTLDPYGVCNEFPKRLSCVGRAYFARSPENNIWVEFGDLPETVRTALWRRIDDAIAKKHPDYKIGSLDDVPF